MAAIARLVLLVTLTLFLASQDPILWAVPCDEIPKNRVLAEYPNALAEMEDIFSRVHGQGILTLISNAGMSDEQVTRFQISFARNGGLKKLERALQGDFPKGGPVHEVYCANTKYAFALRKEAKESRFIVSAFGKPDEADIRGTIENYLEQYLLASHAVFGVQVSRMMADPSFAITKVSEVNEEGRTLLRVDYDYHPEEFILRSGSLLLCPEQRWALREYDTQIGKRGRRINGAVEVERTENGIAVPRRVTEDAPAFLETKPFHNTFEIERIDFRALPEKEFTLSAFGLPEMGAPGKKEYTSHLARWIFGGAALALVIAVILRKLATMYRT